MTTGDDAGLVRLCAGHLVWETRVGQALKLEMRSVALVGEWIDDDGISIDPLSHRLVLVTCSGEWYDVPVAAAGFEFLRSEVAAVVPGCEINLELFGTTTASRVIWPEVLRGKPVFVYVPAHGQSLIGRVVGVLGARYEVQLSDDVRSYLDS